MSSLPVNDNCEPAEFPESGIERQFIDEYLHQKGYERETIADLPQDQRLALVKDACLYAALKLANIEAKAGFRHTFVMP